MIDLQTIKPGDVVSLDIAWCGQGFAVDEVTDSVRKEIHDGDRFVVANPPLDPLGWRVRLMHGGLPSGVFLCGSGYCSLVESAATNQPASCTCDSFDLMIRGCKCGQIQREREAHR